MPNYGKQSETINSDSDNFSSTVHTYHASKKTLFNLYAFTYHDSYQKPGTSSQSDPEVPYSGLDRAFKIPSLTLKNVEIRNFLNDYQALIYVEKDNYVVQEISFFQASNRVVKHYGNFNADANIVIESTMIVDSSFALGMLYVPPKNFISGKQFSDIVYRFNDNLDTRYPKIEEKLRGLNNE